MKPGTWSSNHHVGTGTPRPSPVKQAALAAGVPVLEPPGGRDPALPGQLAATGADIGVACAFGYLLPEAVLAALPGGIINLHFSLLPAYRGAAPVHRAVIDGRTETGVTIMRVVRELDAGPILARATQPIGPDDTSLEVEQALARLGGDLLLDVVERLAAHTASEEPQEHDRATYAHKLTKAEADALLSGKSARIRKALGVSDRFVVPQQILSGIPGRRPPTKKPATEKTPTGKPPLKKPQTS